MSLDWFAAGKKMVAKLRRRGGIRTQHQDERTTQKGWFSLQSGTYASQNSPQLTVPYDSKPLLTMSVDSSKTKGQYF